MGREYTLESGFVFVVALIYPDASSFDVDFLDAENSLQACDDPDRSCQAPTDAPNPSHPQHAGGGVDAAQPLQLPVCDVRYLEG